MAIGTLTEIGSGTGLGEVNVTTNAAIAAGDLVIVSVATGAGDAYESLSVELPGESLVWAGGVGEYIAEAGGGNVFYVVSAGHLSGVDIEVRAGWLGDIANVAVKVYKVSGMLAASPLDKSVTATGASATPSTGASGIPATTNELVFASVATLGPVADADGTWGNVNGIGSQVGTGTASTGACVSDAWITPIGSGGLTASKSGITSRTWFATLVTFQGAPDPQSTVVSASGAAGAGLVATNPGTDTSAVVSAGASSGAECVSGSVHFNPPLSMNVLAGIITPPIDGFTDLPLPTAQAFAKIGQRNLRSLGKPHFAFTHQAALSTSPISGGEYGIGGLFNLSVLPTAKVSSEEVHWLFSFHDAGEGGSELLSVGITPSGRFAFASGGNGTIFSAYGAVPVDGMFHYVRFDLYSNGQRQAFLDGVGLLDIIGGPSDYPQPGGGTAAPFSSRFCLFNGRDGGSALDCSVAMFEVSAEEGSISWPVNEGNGGTISDCGLGDWSLDLAATWFDGTPLDSCPEFPNLPLVSAYTWGRATSWTPRRPLKPEYTKVVSP